MKKFQFSYPYNNQGKFGTNIVVRGIDSDELDVVAKKLMSTLL
jgi:MOSC domain-containing protein YiiM